MRSGGSDTNSLISRTPLAVSSPLNTGPIPSISRTLRSPGPPGPGPPPPGATITGPTSTFCSAVSPSDSAMTVYSPSRAVKENCPSASLCVLCSEPCSRRIIPSQPDGGRFHAFAAARDRPGNDVEVDAGGKHERQLHVGCNEPERQSKASAGLAITTWQIHTGSHEGIRGGFTIQENTSAVRTVGPEVAGAHSQRAEKPLHDRFGSARWNQPREDPIQPTSSGVAGLPVKSITAVGLQR